MKILLIEDDLIWQIKIRELLYSINTKYKVDICGNLEESLFYLQSYIPDIIIADVVLEDDLVFELFDNYDYRDIPCIFMTVSETKEFYHLSKKVISSIYLIKPFQMLSLQSAIDSVLESQVRKLGKRPQGIPVKGKNNERITLKPVDIVIVESEANYCILNSLRNKYVIKASMKKLKEDLGYEFIQIHKKYLVNKNYIINLNIPAMQVTTEIGVFRIGRRYKHNLLEYLNEKKLI